MQFSELVSYFQKLEKISSRLKLREILLDLYSKLTYDELQIVSYFLQGRLAPPYVDLEFNISEKTIDRYILEAFSTSSLLSSDPEKQYKNLKLSHRDSAGAYEVLKKSFIKANDRTISFEDLSITRVYSELLELTLIEGVGSVKRRLKLLDGLLAKLSPAAGKYIIRLILGRLRLGVSVRTILDMLAYHYSLVSKDAVGNAKKHFDRAYGITSDIGYVGALYFKEGFQAVQKVRFIPGVPIALQLAEREPTLEACLKRIPYPYVDPKLDGLRGQIHIFDRTHLGKDYFEGRVWAKAYLSKINKKEQSLLSNHGNDEEYVVKIFSRNLEDLTPMFPEIHDWAKIYADKIFETIQPSDLKAVVFDSELIGYNESLGEFYPFQVTMTRRRKYSVSKLAQQIPIRAFVFDVMFYKKEVLTYPFRKRRELLEEIFSKVKADTAITLQVIYKFDKREDTHKVLKTVENLFYDYVSRGVEGIMIKDPNAPYEPGVRKFNWIKFKRAMKSELADTLDLVVLGYYYGKGRLASFGIGGLLVGVYDKDKDEYLTVSKVGTGFADADWLKIKGLLDDLKVDKPVFNVRVSKELIPDVWVYPQLVIEVEADEITKSPIHTAGLALRFPRFKRIREDKTSTQATTLKELKELMAS